MAQRSDDSVDRPPWLRAWLTVGLAAWAELGVLLVTRANNQGLVEDISISPYHLVGYAALLVLAAYVGWAFFRALRRGSWRTAFPPLYGGLGLAFVLLAGWVVIDPIWRDTVGIGNGIENGLAPPRLLIPAALVLLAAGPLREVLADRAAAHHDRATVTKRWAGVVAIGLIGAALTLVAFNPVQQALNDWSIDPGVDNTEIWTMAADGSDQSRLLGAYGDGIDYSLPVWSPDGKRIAFTRWSNNGGVTQNVRNEDQTAGIWTMAIDGTDQRQVVDGAPDQAWIPAWSPDGQWISYTLSLQGPRASADVGPEANAAPGGLGPPSAPSGSSIWFVHPDGSGARRITPEGIDAINGVWSPDGTRFAYVGGSGGVPSDIHVATIAADGTLSDDRGLATDPAVDGSPAWSPDGRSIAFASNRSGNDDIWVVAADGTGTPRQLTADTASDWVPAFSRDGTQIAFVSDRSGDADVWLMHADGADPKNLSRHALAFDGTWSVAWSPDGDRLVYASAPFQDASSSGWVREDLATAQSLIFGVVLAVLALLLVAVGAPLGSFTIVLLIVVGAGVVPTDEWRFLPAALVAGLLADGLVWSAPGRWRGHVAAATFPAATLLSVGLTIGIGGTLAWSITLLLGVALAAGLLGWALAEAAERLFPHAPRAGVAAGH